MIYSICIPGGLCVNAYERMFQSHNSRLFKFECEKPTAAPVHVTTYPAA